MPDLKAPHLYPVTLEPDKPCLSFGIPISILERLISNTAELVRPILNCDFSEIIEDSETNKDFLFIKRNLEPDEDIDSYLAEALRISEMILNKIATLMSDQNIDDNVNKGEFWRLLIDLNKDWENNFPDPANRAKKDYGWKLGASSLQWNELKGVLRIKTRTLEELRKEISEIAETILTN